MRPVKQMMSTSIRFLFITAIVLLSISMVNAQDDHTTDLAVIGPDSVQIIELKNNSRLVGRTTEIVGDTALVTSDAGRMRIALSQIKSVKTVPSASIVDGKYWFPNPNKTRLYFSPTARMLDPGEGYITDIYIFFPGAAVGLTKNFSLEGGLSIFPGLDFDEQFYYIIPKAGYSVSEQFDIALAGLIVRLPDFDDVDDDPSAAGIVYALSTWGNDDAGFTFGLGWGYSDKEFENEPAFLIGGDYRFTRRLAFVSENWKLPGVDEPVVSYGLRFLGESISFDLGLVNVIDEDAVFPGVPYIDFIFSF